MDRKQLSMACILAAAMVPVGARSDPGSAFQYQGRLTDNGIPKTGTVGLQFTVWDDAAAGNQVGPTLSFPSISVANGLFTQQLDFGEIFNGVPSFLQIEVDGDGGSDNLTPLSPRRPLLPVPYAQHAGGAGALVSPSGETLLSPTGQGLLGMGANPIAGLHIDAGPAPSSISQLDFSSEADGPVAVSENERNLAFVALDASNFIVGIDVSNPSDIRRLGSGTGGFNISPNSEIHAEGNYVYVSETSAVAIVNVANAASPAFVSRISDGPSEWLLNLRGMQVRGNNAYVISEGEDALSIIDLSNKSTPTRTGVILDSAVVFMDQPVGLDVTTDRAYVISQIDKSLTTIDIQNHSAPIHLGGVRDDSVGGTIPNLDLPTAVSAQEGTHNVFITSAGNILSIDATNPGAAVQLDIWDDLTIDFDDIEVVGSRAYAISSTDRRIALIDVSEPSDLQVLQIAPSLAFNPVDLYCRDGKIHLACTNRYELYQSVEPFALLVDGIAAKSSGPYWSIFSDERLKQDIVPLDHSLDLITKLQPVQFRYAPAWQGVFGTTPDGRVHPGFVAQQYQQVFPDDVHTDPSSGYLQIDPSATLPHLVGAIKEQQAEIERLRADRDALEARLKALEDAQQK